jgi:serine/threonine protein kinase
MHKARDTRLDREVAIKVLPAVLAQDPERLARFEREAKVLALLNHPNIAQIYGIEESSSGGVGSKGGPFRLRFRQPRRSRPRLLERFNYRAACRPSCRADHSRKPKPRALALAPLRSPLLW